MNVYGLTLKAQNTQNHVTRSDSFFWTENIKKTDEQHL